MSRRDKIVAAVVAAAAALALLYALADRLILGPIEKLDRQERALVTGSNELRVENARLRRHVHEYVALRKRTFADTTLRAGVLVGRRINELARRAGLEQGELTVQTFTRGGGAGSFSQVGCRLHGTMSLRRLTNLLYLLREDAYLHRITTLKLQPQKDRDQVAVALLYATPVLDGKLPGRVVDRRQAATRPAEPASLTSAGRSAYDVIPERNLFKPYVPRTVRRPPPRRPERRPSRPDPPAPAPRAPRVVVTGLPARDGHPEVHLTRPNRPEAKVYKVGDKLPVGRIVMVDYRVLPHPSDPKRRSSGRVILRVGKDYWAVERGQSLDQRRLLRPEELPEALRPRPSATAPAGRPASGN